MLISTAKTSNHKQSTKENELQTDTSTDGVAEMTTGVPIPTKSEVKKPSSDNENRVSIASTTITSRTQKENIANNRNEQAFKDPTEFDENCAGGFVWPNKCLNSTGDFSHCAYMAEWRVQPTGDAVDFNLIYKAKPNTWTGIGWYRYTIS